MLLNHLDLPVARTAVSLAASRLTAPVCERHPADLLEMPILQVNRHAVRRG